MHSEVSNCRSCNAKIMMLKTATGKFMPVDAVPVPHGNLEVHNGECRVIRKTEVYDGDRYISHFATCVSANQHRKVNSADQHQA